MIIYFQKEMKKDLLRMESKLDLLAENLNLIGEDIKVLTGRSIQ
jgi:hypothetical protein